MASPSTSSSEVVDLGTAADLDDATSRVFFADGHVSGAEMSWPAAEQMRSTLTSEAALRRRCEKHRVPKDYTPRCAGGSGPCNTPAAAGASNAICVYVGALKAGMRFPLHELYVQLLQHYDLAPSQLTPNAWAYMAAFLQVCKEAGAMPLPSVFRYFFSLCAHKGDNLGWYHFRSRAVTPYGNNDSVRRLFSGAPTRSFGTRSWKANFFFLEPPPGTPWSYPSSWGKPRREAVQRVSMETMTSATREAALKLLSYVERLGVGSTGIHINQIIPLAEPLLPVGPPTNPPDGAAPVKLEARKASKASDAAGESDGMMRKRKSPAAAAPVTPPTHCYHQSLADMSTPPGFTPDQRSFSDSGDLSMPPGICAHDALHLYDAMVGLDDEKNQLQEELRVARAKAAEDAVRIAMLQGQLQEARDGHAQLLEFLRAPRDEIAQLKANVARLQEEHDAKVAKASQEHAAAVAQLTEQLKEEHAANIAQVKKEHAADIARVKDAAEKEVQDAKKNMVLAVFPHLDASLLERPKA